MALRPSNLRYYKDVVRLLWRYGRADLVRDTEAPEELEAAAEPARDPEAFVRDLEALGPTFVKLGQLLSTRPDIIAAPYVQALERLQDDMAPFPYEEVRALFVEEMGLTPEQACRKFEREPLAAASLAQVHRAVLRDGRVVVVKVQRPDVRRRVAEDLSALGDIARFLDEHSAVGRRYNALGIYEELRKSLRRELSYEQEAANLTRLRENLSAFRHIVVPEPVEALSGSRVLTMTYHPGRNLAKVAPDELVGVDGHELADELLAAYLKQVLVDGFFHADPHPGNVLLTEAGDIALLDLGMVAHVSPDLRQHLIQLILGAVDGRAEQVVEVARRIAPESEDFDESGLLVEIREVVEEFRAATLERMEVGAMVVRVARAATGRGLQVPTELTLLGKALMNLDRIGRVLDPRFDPEAAIRREVAGIMERHMRGRASLQALSSALLETNEFVTRFPERLNRIMDNLAHDRLRIRVEALDERTLLQGALKIANRITAGLVLASLVVGAALLVRGGGPFRWLSFQGLAVVFFFVAATGSLVLVWRIVFSDRARLRLPHPRRGSRR